MESNYLKFIGDGNGNATAFRVDTTTSGSGALNNNPDADIEKQKRLEENIVEKVEDLVIYATSIHKNFVSGGLFIKDELGQNNVDIGTKRYDIIFGEMKILSERYDIKKERTPDFLVDCEECKKSLERLIEDIEIWKTEKKDRDKFLELDNNKDWKNIFKSAADKIIKSDETFVGFKKKHPNVKLEFDFNYDLQDNIEKYLLQSQDYVDPISDSEKKIWEKDLAASRLINDVRSAKTCIILEKATYMTESIIVKSAEEKKEIVRKDAIEFLNSQIAEKIKKYCGKKVLDVEGKPFLKDAIFRDMAFIIGKGIIEDAGSLARLEKSDKKSDMKLLPEEEAKIEDLLKKIENDDKKLIHEIAIKSHIYKIITSYNADTKKYLDKKDRILTDQEARDLIDVVYGKFDGDLKIGIDKFLTERAANEANYGLRMDEKLIRQINELVERSALQKGTAKIIGKTAKAGTSTASKEAIVPNSAPEKEKTKEEKVEELFEGLNSFVKKRFVDKLSEYYDRIKLLSDDEKEIDEEMIFSIKNKLEKYNPGIEKMDAIATYIYLRVKKDKK